jgi:hypothetical protein
MDVLRRRELFLLRWPDALRDRAIKAAEQEGLSLNHFIKLAIAERADRILEAKPEPVEWSAMGKHAGFGMLKGNSRSFDSPTPI